MERFDLLVIGGGISGLSLAHACARLGLNTAVLEKEGRLGGALHSERLPGGFWLEMGAHTCYNSYGGLLGIVEQCGLQERLVRRGKAPWVFRVDGRIVPVAKRLHLLELALALPRLMTNRRAGRSVADYYSRVLGRRNFSEVAAPLLSAVVSQDVREFPVEVLFKRRPHRKDFPRSFTLQGGLQALPEAIAGQAGLRVFTGREARRVSLAGGRFRVQATGRHTYEAPALALAAPPEAAAKVLAGEFPQLAAELGRIEERGLISVGVAVETGAVSLPPVAGVVPLHDGIFSIVSRDVVPHPELRGFTFHFKPDTDESYRMAWIEEFLGLPPERWKLNRTSHRTLPAIGVDHGEQVAELDRLLRGVPLALTGNYFGGLAIEDCVARSTAEAARLVGML